MSEIAALELEHRLALRESAIEKLKSENAEIQKQMNMIVDALIAKNHKLTRQVEILKKALEQYAVQYEFKDDGPDYFIAKSALQQCEGIE